MKAKRQLIADPHGIHGNSPHDDGEAAHSNGQHVIDEIAGYDEVFENQLVAGIPLQADWPKKTNQTDVFF